jgi:hypothetical protein
MLVGRESTVVNDYDFRIGKNHLRGKGWLGLVALAITLTFRMPPTASLIIFLLWLAERL